MLFHIVSPLRSHLNAESANVQSHIEAQASFNLPLINLLLLLTTRTKRALQNPSYRFRIDLKLISQYWRRELFWIPASESARHLLASTCIARRRC